MMLKDGSLLYGFSMVAINLWFLYNVYTKIDFGSLLDIMNYSYN